MDVILTSLGMFLLLCFSTWIGWMWGNMRGYEDGFKDRDRIQKEVEELIEKHKR